MTNPVYDDLPFYVSGYSGGGGGPVTGVAIPQSAADFVDSVSYSDTLGPGTYTRATLLAMMAGPTRMLSFSVTCVSGTMDFQQGGNVLNMSPSTIIDKPYAVGFTIDDFTLTVDPGSTAYVEARGV